MTSEETKAEAEIRMSAFEVGTEVALIFKSCSFFPIPDPCEGVKIVSNVVKAIYLGDRRENDDINPKAPPGSRGHIVGYYLRFTGFDPQITNAYVRDEDVLIIGEISNVTNVGKKIVRL